MFWVSRLALFKDRYPDHASQSGEEAVDHQCNDYMKQEEKNARARAVGKCPEGLPGFGRHVGYLFGHSPELFGQAQTAEAKQKVERYQKHCADGSGDNPGKKADHNSVSHAYWILGILYIQVGRKHPPAYYPGTAAAIGHVDKGQ